VTVRRRRWRGSDRPMSDKRLKRQTERRRPRAQIVVVVGGGCCRSHRARTEAVEAAAIQCGRRCLCVRSYRWRRPACDDVIATICFSLSYYCYHRYCYYRRARIRLTRASKTSEPTTADVRSTIFVPINYTLLLSFLKRLATDFGIDVAECRLCVLHIRTTRCDINDLVQFHKRDLHNNIAMFRSHAPLSREWRQCVHKS